MDCKCGYYAVNGRREMDMNVTGSGPTRPLAPSDAGDEAMVKALGVSHECVRQLELRALAKSRKRGIYFDDEPHTPTRAVDDVSMWERRVVRALGDDAASRAQLVEMLTPTNVAAFDAALANLRRGHVIRDNGGVFELGNTLHLEA